MRGNELLDKMGLIDPDYVEAAEGRPEKKKRGKFGAIAACLCLFAAAAVAVPHIMPDNKPTPAAEQSEAPGTAEPNSEAVPDMPRGAPDFRYNEASGAVDAARKYIPGYFTEELTEEELAGIIPDRQAADMSFSGRAGFDGEGTLLEVIMQVEAPFLNGADVTVLFSADKPVQCYTVPGEPEISKLNGHDFEVYEWSPGGEDIYYDAFGKIGGCFMQISYKSEGVPGEQARADFEVIADCFTTYTDGKPELSAVRADAIPEFRDISLTLSEAREDADFGAYMPSAVPDGYGEESVRRYKDQNNDYLSGLWTNGYDELSWQVSLYTERDANRLTEVGKSENYDLSLYPIPRADSVPDDKREIVNDPIFIAEELTLDAVRARAYGSGESGDSDGCRMQFGVKFDDRIVRVRSKGVEPEWMYEQLMSLRS